MKNGLFKKLLPHLIAVLVFLVVAVIYCKPILEGKVINQADVTHWKGAIQNSEEYKKVHGDYPLWSNGLFSGMPAFQIGGTAKNYVSGYFHEILTLHLPVPIQFFFLACICFYFLSIVVGVRPYIGILGALAFAYATYNPVIISVGHDTKMWSIAYMPGVLGSVLLIYERRKYWLGAALTALFTSAIIAMNHLQISYYLFLTIGIMTLFYLVRWILNKDFRHLLISAALTVFAITCGVLTNAVSILSTYEYQKETIRGGPSALADTSGIAKSQTGLDKDYGLSYSMKISEPFVMMFPKMFGGSSSPIEVSEEKSKAIEEFNNISQTIYGEFSRQMSPQQAQQQTQSIMRNMQPSFYWGGMTKANEVGVSGPPYVGAIICFLALLGMFLLDRKYKWWILTCIVATVIMSWGSYFESINGFLFEKLPFYNKFRAPSMILVIPQLLLPLLAILCLDLIVKTKDRRSLWPAFKKGLIATSVIFVVLLLLYFSFDFMADNNKELLKQVRSSNQPTLADAFKKFFDGEVVDRKSLMMGSILRSFAFIALAAIMLFLLIRDKIKPVVAVIGITLFSFIDVIAVDAKYLNSDNYQDKDENEASFKKNSMDDAILADKSFYRVFNIAGNAFSGGDNFTSYYYNSVGGYHPAKLRLYLDLIDKRLNKEGEEIFQALQTNPDSISKVKTPSLNMLNAKYFIYKDNTGETKAQWKNVNALGNCWFVNQLLFVNNPNEEMKALDSIDPKITAVVNKDFKKDISFTPQPDSSAKIQLVKNDNDKITYTSESTTNQFAVFSEVYYKAGWRAFVDGKEYPIIKTDYVLRGLALPAGKHNIEFRFEPQGYMKGKSLTLISSIILALLVLFAIYMERKRNKMRTANA
jgi:membrane protein YfhO